MAIGNAVLRRIHVPRRRNKAYWEAPRRDHDYDAVHHDFTGFGIISVHSQRNTESRGPLLVMMSLSGTNACLAKLQQ